MRFYLGAHHPTWLARVDFPLFVSRRTLSKRRSRWPAARAPWALDSGGYIELSKHGRWTISIHRYAEEVDEWWEMGRLEWAAQMDWMCESEVLRMTGLSVREHQERTVQNFLDLTDRFTVRTKHLLVPVVQGWTIDDYERHVSMFAEAGVDLRRFDRVGIGSICRRNAEQAIAKIVDVMAVDHGLAPHAFGVKGEALRLCHDRLASADSMAWSAEARINRVLLPECRGAGHRVCNNCERYARRWRTELLGTLEAPAGRQLTLA